MNARSTRDGSESQPGIEPLAWAVPEAAKALGIGESLLARLVSVDAVPSLRIAGRRVFRPAELRAWLDDGAPTEPGSAAVVREHLARQREGGSA